MLITCDVGGTKTVFASVSGDPGSIILASVKRYENEVFSSFEDTFRAYLEDVSFGPVKTVVIAAAGVVTGNTCLLSSLNWRIDGEKIQQEFSAERVHILNDLLAAAYGINCLGDDSLEVIHEGSADPGGNRVLISPGTGLGESIIHVVDGRHIPIASEGGHADFAPTDGTMYRLWEYIRRIYGRVSVEDIVSGTGLFNIYSFLAEDAGEKVDEAIILSTQPGGIITERALENTDSIACRTVELFLDALASEAGCMALKVLASGGVYLGGGFLHRIFSNADKKRFARMFADKGVHQQWLEKCPIYIVNDTELPLYGGAEFILSQG